MTFGQSKLPAAPDAAALGRQEAQHGAAFDPQHVRERTKGISVRFLLLALLRRLRHK